MTATSRTLTLLRWGFVLFLAIVLGLIMRDGLVQDWSMLERVNGWWLLPAVGFAVLDVAIDFLVWWILLREVYPQAKPVASLTPFLAGFAVDLLPAKVGTFSRAWFLRILWDIPMRLGVAVQSNAALIDLLAATLIAILGLGSLGLWKTAGLIGLLVSIACGVVFAVIFYPHLQGWVQRVIRPFVPAEMAFGIHELQESIKNLLQLRLVLPLALVKGISWLAMGLVLYAIAQCFHQPLSVTEALFVVAGSALLGLFSMVPNGLGITEASLVGFLTYLDLPLDTAILSAFLFRIFTMWAWLLIGNLAGQRMARLVDIQKQILD
ncbi:MAG: flippase-like domain-containing protein [Magnetococcales bacterium]|nr:flippase-like domain-containing protein [Magnetococcales bacterium]